MKTLKTILDAPVKSASFRTTPAELESQGYELWTEIPYWSNYHPDDAIRNALINEEYTEIVIRRVCKYGRMYTQIWGKKK